MASKRKSTIPCMIPSKNKYIREDIILGCLPELLPTIPEDSILSISSKDKETQQIHETKTSCWERGTYNCLLCCFDTGDLNVFLYHLEDCHTVFHAHPNFYCVPCKVPAVKFEELALHNAKSHPELHSLHKRVSLKVTKRDGAIIVEQTLFTEDDFNEYGISTTKTPIMKTTKGGRKKIVVSHTVEVHHPKPSSDRPSILTNGTSVRNLKTATHIISGTNAPPLYKVSNVLGIPGMLNRGPVWNSNQSLSDSNANLPKVMIPLSSIPTYDPAMDLSSFLKTSFGKFPYPTKAELCYLTVVSGFPEEQIKLWFTAQRLKQGISWSPEEIEETKRRMFNTVFQATTKTSRNQSQLNTAQHRFPVHASNPSSNIIQQVPKGTVMGWKGGVIVSQPTLTQATSFKQQQPVVQIHHIETTKETGSDISCHTAENTYNTNRGSTVNNSGHTGKGDDGSSSSMLPGTSKSQNSSYSEASIVNLTNIVRKIDCHINDGKVNCTSKSNVSPTSIFVHQTASSTTKESSNCSVATTSKYNDGSTCSSTSHTTICTKREGNILEYTSKSNNDISVICSSSSIKKTEIQPLTHNLAPQSGGMDPSFGKGNISPENPGSLKQINNQDSFVEQKQFLAPPCPSFRLSLESKSEFKGLFSNLHEANPPGPSCLQEEPSQHSGPSLSGQREHPQKSLPGTAQIQFRGKSAAQNKEHDTNHIPALNKYSKQSDFEKENLQRNITQCQNEGMFSEPQLGVTHIFQPADKKDSSKQANSMNTFINEKTNKQGISLLRQYIQEVDQWESNSNFLEASNMSPMKINVMSVNKSENLFKSVSKPIENSVNNSSSSWNEKEFSERRKSLQHIDAEEQEFESANTQSNQPDKHEALSQDRKSIFQSLDSVAPTLPIKKNAKDAMRLSERGASESLRTALRTAEDATFILKSYSSCFP
ncbi:hypothetical protein DNTS_015905 [Danionella cerebrum]|uniref:Homeobox domain-containing protein n=1 Tax=Danionella cerebrum TaxID=2873325 RepID=A0A553NM57_9TELE|nr:hypothetical protein DNTS_015905 [Danionella translucida]